MSNDTIGGYGYMQDREIKKCAYCGKVIKTNPAALKRRKYCSKECTRKGFLKIGYNNSSWSDTHTTARKINELILHKEKCEKCGKTGKLDIHHIDENPNNNNLDNLMCLCRSCHMKTHHPKPICKVDGCENPVKGYGYCEKHYQRYKKTGDPLLTKFDLRKEVVANE
jgi:hypothetical protein